jgi:hypothetical protein
MRRRIGMNIRAEIPKVASKDMFSMITPEIVCLGRQ